MLQMPSNLSKKFKKVLEPVSKHTLPNGLTILVRPTTTIPKVSSQLWYHVGSKDEGTGQKGLAHLIEHMIFKGTDRLSESDINTITHKLSGSCNAFTSYDYTGYLFDFPTQNWLYGLDIMADCMRNVTFKEELLYSELKAVIQELKMYKDHYVTSLAEAMMTSLFADHPYHYPIIGYKQDLWSLDRQELIRFYRHHYVPNNATLVVVGDVQPEKVFEKAQDYFGAIAPDTTYQRKIFYHNQDLIGSEVTLYREISQSYLMLGFVVPGLSNKSGYVLDVLTWLLGLGKGSRLHNKLIHEKDLATDVECFVYDLFDYSVFFIVVEPKELELMDQIIELVSQELHQCAKNGFTQAEFQRAIKKTESAYWHLLESNQKQAYELGRFFLATGDEHYLLNYLNHEKNLAERIQDILCNYLRPSIMCTGKVIPFQESERKYWLCVQEQSDQEDARVLQGKVREAVVEPPMVASTIEPASAQPFTYPRYSSSTLANGTQLFWYHNPNVPKIELVIEFAAKHYFDPQELQGISLFVSNLLSEGTKQHSAVELAQLLGSYGMTFTAWPGYVSLSMLSEDFEEGLSILHEILTESLFAPEAVERVRAKLIANLKSYWDEPTEFVTALVKKYIYKGHPYSKSAFGELEAIKKITREQILDWYQKTITPHGTAISIVGDIQPYPMPSIVENYFGKWQGKPKLSIEFPELKAPEPTFIAHPINRDQIVLCFADLSISRKADEYDALLLFDQIFGGGVLGSMSSKLFDLREQTGLFYTIQGSLIAGAEEEPGLVLIKTIVSIDRLEEAEHRIKQMVNGVIDAITQEELDQAKDALNNSLVDNFETNRKIAHAFLFLRKYDLSPDYFDKRAQRISSITLDQVKQAARNVLNPDRFTVVKIGRIAQEKAV